MREKLSRESLSPCPIFLFLWFKDKILVSETLSPDRYWQGPRSQEMEEEEGSYT